MNVYPHPTCGSSPSRSSLPRCTLPRLSPFSLSPAPSLSLFCLGTAHPRHSPHTPPSLAGHSVGKWVSRRESEVPALAKGSPSYAVGVGGFHEGGGARHIPLGPIRTVMVSGGGVSPPLASCCGAGSWVCLVGSRLFREEVGGRLGRRGGVWCLGDMSCLLSRVDEICKVGGAAEVGAGTHFPRPSPLRGFAPQPVVTVIVVLRSGPGSLNLGDSSGCGSFRRADMRCLTGRSPRQPGRGVGFCGP